MLNGGRLLRLTHVGRIGTSTASAEQWHSRLIAAAARGWTPLPKPARDVVFRFLFLRRREELRGRPELDERAFVEERGEVGHASRLLHVVRDDNDRVLAAQFGDQVLDAGRRPWIQGRARFVHQNDLRIDGDGAGNAEPLMLAAGQSQGRLAQPIFDFVPQRRAFETRFHHLVEHRAVTDAGDPQAISDVLVDGLGKRCRPLEDHAHAAAQFDDVERRVGDVLAVQQNLAGRADIVDQVVHAIQAAQQGRLAAAGRSDQAPWPGGAGTPSRCRAAPRSPRRTVASRSPARSVRRGCRHLGGRRCGGLRSAVHLESGRFLVGNHVTHSRETRMCATASSAEV